MGCIHRHIRQETAPRHQAVGAWLPKAAFALTAAQRAYRSAQYAAARPAYLSLLHKRHEGHLDPYIWAFCPRQH